MSTECSLYRGLISIAFVAMLLHHSSRAYGFGFGELVRKIGLMIFGALVTAAGATFALVLSNGTFYHVVAWLLIAVAALLLFMAYGWLARRTNPWLGGLIFLGSIMMSAIIAAAILVVMSVTKGRREE